MKIVGITGGVGCGKSTVLTMLEQCFGASVLLADRIAHDLMEPGAINYKQIIKQFGSDIIKADGFIDRKELGALVFQDPVKLERLNQIVHPNVKKEILNRIEQLKRDRKTSFIAVEAALLIEAGYESICDELWYVYASKEVRIKRLMDSRGYSREKCIAIMKNQLSEADFRETCHWVIDNNYDYSSVKEQLSKRVAVFLGTC